MEQGRAQGLDRHPGGFDRVAVGLLAQGSPARVAGERVGEGDRRAGRQPQDPGSLAVLDDLLEQPAAAERLAAAQPSVDPRIYENTFDAVLEAIHETPDDVGCLAVVGHNPSIGGLAHELGDGSFDSGFPAGGVAVLELPGPYAALGPGTATLTAVHLPGR